jgi:hypothetical protein
VGRSGLTHKEWLAWLKKHVKFSQQQASRLMQLGQLLTVSNLVDEWRRICGRAQDEGSDNGEAIAASEGTELGKLSPGDNLVEA